MAKSIRAILAGYTLPGGYTAALAGGYTEMKENISALGHALLVSVGLVYFVLASQFESFVMPVIIMKILPIVTTVFLPLSLIAGWYGMNFVNMPELTARHGYLAVCIVSAVCILVELVIFKWKKWL